MDSIKKIARRFKIIKKLALPEKLTGNSNENE